MSLKPLLVVVAAVSLLGAACGSDSSPPAATGGTDGATARSSEWTGSAAGFYRPPEPLPGGKHGDLIRFQRVDDAITKVLYLSESVKGDPIAVSGIVAMPAGGGEHPVMTWAHGTTGLADQCAPSKSKPDERFRAFLDNGMIVAATDYEGLGTPGLHPYLAGISEGRGTLDIVRAVKQLPGSTASDDVIIWGHSQGGHAALFANQIAGEWTPELHVLGTVAGAPPSELLLIADALKGGNFQGYLAMVAGGLNAAYPEAKLPLLLTPEALGRMHVLDEGCTAEVFAAFNGLPYDDFAKANPASVPVWRKVLAENDPGHVKTPDPILVIHGEADEQIPPVASKLLFDRLCGLGQVIERRTYPGQSHAGVIGPSFEPMMAWMLDRIAGKPTAGGCPAPTG